MKVIRRCIFETNSSSSHTITIVDNFSKKEMYYRGYDDYTQYNSPIKKIVFVFGYIQRLKEEKELQLSEGELSTLKNTLIKIYNKTTNKTITEEKIDNLIFYYFQDIDTVGIDKSNEEFFTIFKPNMPTQKLEEILEKYFKSTCYLVDVENE